MLAHTLLPVEEFIERRQRLLSAMPTNSIALFAAAHEVTRSNDTEYPFCQNKNFYYLTGFNEPEALLVLIKEFDDSTQCLLFCREKNPEQEVWHGRRIGPDNAQTLFGFDLCYSNAETDEHLPLLLNGKQALWFCQGEQPYLDQQVFNWLAKLRSTPKQGTKAPQVIFDCRSAVHELRLIKSAGEIAIMRKANEITGSAHQRAMEKSSIGKFEYQIEAELHHEFARFGARFPAYASIVAGGDNANILHYTDNSDVLEDNNLLLIDAGCELAGYAADLTRTFPVNGKFSEPQKAIYDLVLKAQNVAINAIKPGQTFAELNRLVGEVLTSGLSDLGILTGDKQKLIEENACKQYFIHGLGHWLGLDVHDVGDYQVDQDKQQRRAFEPGMVMTIEPGLYIPKDCDAVDEKWRGIGVRIEDNVLVTAQGFENLTTNAPKTVDEIEALMQKRTA